MSGCNGINAVGQPALSRPVIRWKLLPRSNRVAMTIHFHCHTSISGHGLRIELGVGNTRSGRSFLSLRYTYHGIDAIVSARSLTHANTAVFAIARCDDTKSDENVPSSYGGGTNDDDVNNRCSGSACGRLTRNQPRQQTHPLLTDKPTRIKPIPPEIKPKDG